MPALRLLLRLSILALLAACSPGQSVLAVRDAWARAAEASSTQTSGHSGDNAHSGAVSAAYMVIENTGNAADRLLRVATDAATTVEIHATQMEDNVMRMRPLPDGLEIPAGGQVILEPGGYHLMLIGLQRHLMAGEHLSFTLTFASGKQLVIEAEIRAP
ncbi:MAG: copper chaperone PCu(A)C [Anaerolineae bacterium]|nr:copper chaperone PCu(A)C [Anaerolineae bacterium]